MDFFLVDYENVNTPGLNGLKNLTAEDVVVIFYSDKADTMTFGLHKRLNEALAEIRYQKVSVGTRNALDFQLCSYLGYAICQNAGQDVKYYVVSRDREYRVLSNYWSHRKIQVSLASDLTKMHGPDGAENPDAARPEGKPPEGKGDGKSEAKPVPAEKKDSLEEQLKTVLPEDGLSAAVVAGIIRRSKTRVEVNNALVREFQSQGYDQCTQHAGEIYRLLKPWISGKQGG